jgi:type II secretory pathway pseudopilin PulG
MLKKLSNKSEGFTLIEIVLVLALAALILVMVLLALSGAQKTRRDTQRKNDTNRVLAATENCASNNSGSYATCLPPVGYFSGTDPGGGAYAMAAGAGVPARGTINVSGTLCPGHSGGTAAVRMYQELSATGYCVDNS